MVIKLSTTDGRQEKSFKLKENRKQVYLFKFSISLPVAKAATDVLNKLNWSEKDELTLQKAILIIVTRDDSKVVVFCKYLETFIIVGDEGDR